MRVAAALPALGDAAAAVVAGADSSKRLRGSVGATGDRPVFDGGGLLGMLLVRRSSRLAAARAADVTESPKGER